MTRVEFRRMYERYLQARVTGRVRRSVVTSLITWETAVGIYLDSLFRQKKVDICYMGEIQNTSRWVQEQIPLWKRPRKLLRRCRPEERIEVSNEFRSISGHLFYESVRALTYNG